MRDYKENAEENYTNTPISVLAYINKLEIMVERCAKELEYSYSCPTEIVTEAKELIKLE